MPDILKKGRLTFIILAFSAIIIAGILVINLFEIRQFKRDQDKSLGIIADLKAEEITRWNKYHLTNLGFFAQNLTLIEYTQMLLAGEQTETVEGALVSLFSIIKESEDYYNIYIITPDKKVLWSYDPDPANFSMTSLKNLETAPDHEGLEFNDFYTAEMKKKVLIDFTSPIRGPNRQMIALLVMNIDPEIEFFPMLQSWPLPYVSAEMQLLTKEGDSVIYINKPSNSDAPPMTIRNPMTRKDLPMVQAFLGKTGFVESRDYRGVKVLGHIKTVQDTPWKLIAKIDKSELYADVSRRMVKVLSVISLIFFASIIGIGLVRTYLDRARLSEQVEKERQLRESLEMSEKKYRNLINSSKDAILLGEAGGTVYDANPAAEMLFGWKKEEFIRHGSELILDPEDHRVKDLLQERALTGKANQELNFIRKDGSRLVADATSSTFQDDTGKVHTINIFHDLTSRKLSEETVYRQSERLKILRQIDQAILLSIDSPETIARTSAQHLIRLLSCHTGIICLTDQAKKYLKVFFFDGETILEDGLMADKLNSILAGGELVDTPGIRVVEDSQETPLSHDLIRQIVPENLRSYIYIPLLSSSGYIGFLCMGWMGARSITLEEREITLEVSAMVTIATEHAWLMETTRRFADQLEKKVKLRTEELNEVNNELRSFTYTVGHDLRSPLRAIHGFASLLLNEYQAVLDEEGRRLCSVIIDNGARLGRLVDDLLTFTRLSQWEMVVSEIDMKGLVTSVMAELSTPSVAGRIDLHLGPLPRAKGDLKLIRQVWVNLLSNAIKFSSQNETISLTIRGKSKNGMTEYSVTDNGIGFDPQYKDKIFDIFQKLHNGKYYEGTGIGLAIAQRIIQRHGGAITGESNPGGGATFSFSLPS